MKVEISNGELVDKWTILTIKLERISNEVALKNVIQERNELTEGVQQLKVSGELIKSLFEANISLWSIEDKIREKERLQEYDDEFISLARSVYIMNDLRAGLKREINETTNSLLVEEKSYAPYEDVDEKVSD